MLVEVYVVAVQCAGWGWLGGGGGGVEEAPHIPPPHLLISGRQLSGITSRGLS